VAQNAHQMLKFTREGHKELHIHDYIT